LRAKAIGGVIMTQQQQIEASISSINRASRPTALIVLAVLAAALTLLPAAGAQTFAVLHNFTGGQDGKTPNTGLTMDRAGNLYGTTTIGGANNDGVVWEITP
jgi:uncharacterized repeat protein (TIGR03803 family)